jgi:pimeloyl-ACP methyl ester carboxylesterase
MQVWATAMMERTSLPIAVACNRSMVDTDFRADLRDVTTPTLLIHGDADASAPLPLTGARTAKLMPNCAFKIYEGAPHGLFLTHRQRLNADILQFIGA